MNTTHERRFMAYHGTFLLHVAFIFASFLSPLFLSWRWILVGVLGYYVQILTFKGCILTHFQFKGQQRSFYSYYLRKLGLPVNESVLSFLAWYFFPGLILLTAYIHQA